MKLFVAALFLTAFTTFAVFIPSLNNDFVNLDDGTYVYNNENIRSINLHLLKWIFTLDANPTWHPLTLLSIAVDYNIWGLKPFGYHLTNVIMHTFNTMLVFILAKCLIEFSSQHRGCGLCFVGKQDITFKKTVLTAFLTALLFGIHPLHVESVAWISERKDVLCAFFFLLSLLAYLRYVSTSEEKRVRSYSACLAFFIMSVMSKPMAVTLPAVLLILDFYPFKRLGYNQTNVRTVIFEKMPFFLISLIVSAINIYTQQLGGALRTIESYPLIDRLFFAAIAPSIYLLKVIFPFNLIPYYPSQIINSGLLMFISSLFLLILITLITIRLSKRNRLFLAIWCYYIITLFPVIGLIKVGDHAMADRYMYLPSLGPFILVGLIASLVLEKKYIRIRYKTLIIVLLIVSIFAGVTVMQIRLWRDSITLWSHVINYYPNSIYLSYINRADAYHNLGKYNLAINDYNQAIKMKPAYTEAYLGRASSCSASGNNWAAIIDVNKAIELYPKDARAFLTRGNAYFILRDFLQAINDYNIAISLAPNFADAYMNRGNANDVIGRMDRAIEDYKKAIQIRPRHANAFYNLGIVYEKLGKIEMAFISYKKAASFGSKEAADKLNSWPKRR